ncbi:hypothetical protein RSOLAG22IIIB_08372 [Rhizoctonia solani]|uniref:Uncharacterized protein n=1 Tax=Rhizoctonia solani TaxID=456999 RepID=A0A0K6FT19_9AGAM|nr:hypothetical protein RSOLAG22IIIB_08372 [Rhizoctonia solani]
MPSFAGFYATEDDCREWLWDNEPEIIKKYPRAGIGAVENKAEDFKRSRRVRDSFFIHALPLPRPPDSKGPWALTLVRRYSERKDYLASNRERDDLIRQAVMSEFKLKVSEWSVLWHSKDDPELFTEFLYPETTSDDDERVDIR